MTGGGSLNHPDQQAMQAASADAVFGELLPQFDGQLPAEMVRDYVTQAVADLRGSICNEALPEMVIRLAAVRLEHCLPPGPSTAALSKHTHWSAFAPDGLERRRDPDGRPFTLAGITPHRDPA